MDANFFNTYRNITLHCLIVIKISGGYNKQTSN